MTRPTMIGGYEILAELGRGPTGVVYKVRHSRMGPDRVFALKSPMLLGAAAEVAGRLARYGYEWNALRRLTTVPDPAIPQLYDVGCDAAEQNYYYLSEFVVGNNWKHLIQTKSIDLHRCVQVLATIAGAVQRMHAKQIAHRNLGRSNVLVTAEGAAKLTGFGHVWPLAGAGGLQPGFPTASPEIDVLAFQKMLLRIFAPFHQVVPEPLQAICELKCVPTTDCFVESVNRYLQETSPR